MRNHDTIEFTEYGLKIEGRRAGENVVADEKEKGRRAGVGLKWGLSKGISGASCMTI